MKNVLLVAFTLVILILAGCSANIDKATTVKNSYLFKSFPSAAEVLVVEVDGGSLFVWSPDEKLKEFFAKINPGDQIFLKAQETRGESARLFDPDKAEDLRFHIIREIIKLSDGSRYKKGV